MGIPMYHDKYCPDSFTSEHALNISLNYVHHLPANSLQSFSLKYCDAH